MSEPEKQRQHRISQIYLKGFGYEKNGQWWISVYKAGNTMTENVLISSFTAEVNVFDLPFTNPKLKRHFENTSSRIESGFKTVISNLHNQHRLTGRDQGLLCNFVPNLLCRTEPFRYFIDNLIRFPETRGKFFEEITMFSGDNEDLAEFLSILKIDFQLNVVIGTLMNHMVEVLRKFHMVVIKAPKNGGWITSDNPVCLDKQGNEEWIIPVESEIYFPLSRDFCLFMYHENSPIKTNPLRQLAVNKIHIATLELFDAITSKNVHNLASYMLMPIEQPETDVTGSDN